MKDADLEKQDINHFTPEILKKFQKKKRLPPMSHDTVNRVLLTYSLFLKTFFGIKAPHKQGVDVVCDDLLNMNDQEENLEADCLAHMFWGVLDDICRHFSNMISSEAAQARYMDPESVWITAP